MFGLAKNIIKKLSVILFVASAIGLTVSTFGLYDDVISTAHTLTYFFPNQYGVTPSSTEDGNFRLGVFVSATQIIAAAIAISESFNKKYRITAAVILVAGVIFDAWTDIVFRSGYLTGNIPIAIATTVAFYTFGTEIVNGFSWALLGATWRQAIADIAWWLAYTLGSLLTIKSEWRNFWQAAKRRAERESANRINDRSSPMGYQQQSRYVHQQPSSKNVSSPYQYNRSAPQSGTKETDDMFARLGLHRASTMKSPPPLDEDEVVYEDI